jgi:Zn-dependent peptidase ImmA (M78 family)
MRPKLKIIYSDIYDRSVYDWKFNDEKYDSYRKDTQEFPRYVKKLQVKWDKINDKVFLTTSKVSGLKWKENVISCYVVPKVRPFSDPLTINTSNELDFQIETITHELVHRLLHQNIDKIKSEKFKKEFKSESMSTYNHILVHAILKLTYLHMFGEYKTKQYIKKYDKLPKSYQRVWEIVGKYGAKELISDFISK